MARTTSSLRDIILTTIILFFTQTLTLNVGAQEARHSKLSEGEWWKVRITVDGIYKISGSDISGMTGCKVSDIVVCGSIGGPLSSRNGDPRPDDLEEIAIEVYDSDSDGIFDSEDHILFYATSADRWDYDAASGRYKHTRHPYATTNNVYVSHLVGNHRRVVSCATQTSSSSPMTTARALRVHDIDKVNTHQTGQIWVGERFNSNSREQTISIPLGSTRQGQASVRYALAALSTSNSSFQVTIGSHNETHILGGTRVYGTYNASIPVASSTSLTATIQFTPGENGATGYLDYVEVDAEVSLQASSGVSIYSMYPTGGVATYRVSGATSSTKVWDVTDYNNVVSVPTSLDGSTLTISLMGDKARRIAVFGAAERVASTAIEKIANQDIHGAALPDMVIVCHPTLLSAGERIGVIHSIHDQMEVLVTTQDEVFNEFSSGQKDPIAIREMLRFFRRTYETEGGRSVSHLLLLGKGTYDNRGILEGSLPTVVTYQTEVSFDKEGVSLSTDDIFTYLEEGEDLRIGNTMDVAVGRLPAKSLAEANHLADKIEHYITKSDLTRSDIRGDWRNSIALLADDADPSCPGDVEFTVSSEYVANNILSLYPQMNIDKIYADAYIQQSGADGSFYPDVNNALKKRMDYGCLLLNYIGHGSSQYIGTERFITKSDISNYKNYDQLPYFVTSTCTFGHHDDPAETCGGEEFVLADGGGIACLAATRPISHVEVVNNDMVMYALDVNNTIGEAVRKAKNNRITTQALTLIGDPAIRLNIPINRAVVTHVNGIPVDTMRNDTALVLSTVTIEGEIRNSDGELVTDFDGDLYPEVYDRAKQAHTLANDNEGCEVPFLQTNSQLYKGHTEVSGGRFTFRFTVPRDVQYRFDKSRISMYAKTSTEDATGSYTHLLLGGYDSEANLREVHPEMRLYMNDTNFRNGGITDANPTLIVMLHDSVGINSVGSGLGHDMTAVLDGNTNNTITLNDLYETDIDDGQCGIVRYNLTGLAKGRHTIAVRVWNIFNYSSSGELTFYVFGEDSTKAVFEAYPTPANSHVRISMEHNLKGSIVSANLYIYDMQGRLVRQFTPAVAEDSYVVGPVDWRLDTSTGVRVSPGIYIARFELTTSDGEKIREQGKVVVK